LLRSALLKILELFPNKLAGLYSTALLKTDTLGLVTLARHVLTNILE